MDRASSKQSRQQRKYHQWDKCSLAPQDRPPTKRTARSRCATKNLLGDDDAGFFTLEFGGLRELAAKEFDEASRAGAAVGAQQTHAVEKNQQMEKFGISEAG